MDFIILYFKKELHEKNTQLEKKQLHKYYCKNPNVPGIGNQAKNGESASFTYRELVTDIVSESVIPPPELQLCRPESWRETGL